MPTSGSWRDLAVPCADPECLDAHGTRSLAEPEADGEHRFYECGVCGYTFGWRRADISATAAGVNSEGVCAVGVPEALRRTVSAAMTGPAPLPLLQIGRRPDAHPS